MLKDQKEIMKLTNKEINNYIAVLKNEKEEFEKVCIALAEMLLAPLVCQYDISQIGVDPNYQYNDEGFSGNNMITIDGEDCCYNSKNVPLYAKSGVKIRYEELQQKIDDDLRPVYGLINKEFAINVNDLRKKVNFKNLDEKIKTTKKISHPKKV